MRSADRCKENRQGDRCRKARHHASQLNLREPDPVHEGSFLRWQSGLGAQAIVPRTPAASRSEKKFVRKLGQMAGYPPKGSSARAVLDAGLDAVITQGRSLRNE